MIDAAPGAINVIPGAEVFSLDVRAPAAARSKAIKAITDAIHGIARKRGVAVRIETVYAAEGCDLSPKIMDALENAIAAHGLRPHRLPSARAMTPWR
ncbi:hypothetical protein [Varunaivibrio sulfuroxidans]|uniref:Uncharacterized protein n=1 Tax=Varunaivibrio sulfuroxidans TaxID=1773489 RepID=A0A4R3JCR9_9PROT|nr:hypothetical protein [Varunaivibrio sulfuroxidans]TCS62976.1 hypothetical protein EDD55_10467 [Varunaivibrio sulfuroxidans]WES31946.1 hypothetical protein P3M64_06205 [Varunaivibrio sulfuroxidans]